MAGKKVDVVDETTGNVVATDLTEKQAESFIANAVSSHTYTAGPAADVEPDPTG
jgi:hypothetical protein